MRATPATLAHFSNLYRFLRGFGFVACYINRIRSDEAGNGVAPRGTIRVELVTSSPWSCVLWDVDGTLIDASDGILRRLREVHEHYGRPLPEREDLIHWIGPPQFESFQVQLGMTPEQSTEAVAFYRSLNKRDGSATGARLFPQMGEIMAALHAAGVAQATASSKPETQVVTLMEHFHLAPMLSATVGATADERTLAGKAAIVREALRRLEAAGADISRPVLIGDRHHDVDGGAETGVPVIFVRWGFSEPAEADGAIAVAETPEELRKMLMTD